MDLKVVGQPIGRVEGPDKVSGRMVYTADVDAPDALWGKCLRSTMAHARLARVDASRARQVPGVQAVLTGEDVPDVRVGVSLEDLPVLARDKVRFIGDKIAAVAADTLDAAEQALSLIEVEYEELPAVAGVEDALADGAPVIHERLAGYAGVPGRPADQPNVLSLNEHTAGDVAQGMTEAEVVVEHTFRTPGVHQVYLEPHATVVSTDDDGRIDVWASCKAPFRLKKMLAAQLALEEENIHVHGVALGGDFGGKGSQMDVPVCYYLSRAAGRPVKMVMNYTEELMAGDPRHPSVMRVKLGAKRDGTLVALDSDIYFDSGAYSGFKPSEIDGSYVVNAYRIPNYAIRTYNVYTNGVPGGYMKSPGQPQAVFAIESLLDMLARELDLDPVAIRLRNLMQDGDVLPNKRGMEKIRCRETIEAALAAAGWHGDEAGEDTGRGMALGFRHTGGSGTVNLVVSCSSDGEVTVLTAIPDIGTGTHTLLRQITAELLTVPAEQVKVARGDTDTFDTDAEPGGSKITAMVGRGLVEAVEELRDRITEAAADALGCRADEVTLADGRFSAGGAALAFADVAGRLIAEDEDLTVRKSYQPQRSPVPAFFVQVAEVAVDRETGTVDVKRVVTAHDVGTIINPLGHQGQIDGGFVQGLGYAVMEEMVKDGPRVTTLNLGDYCVPCVKDLPPLETVLVEDQTGPGPYNAKAIGEMSIVPTAPAIANAVEAAVGVRILDLPITAEKVYNALRER
ncbi:MAG: xanthine dehydrogenase family protein molybdopterin-binding subunit [Deltaproteobacteria bacterium]|nr:xanthine dehydrogenase family protein molybdopterin-binding subunit [Deltaproteobacteria bacterium]